MAKITKLEMDTPTKFWTQWLEADEEQRILLVEKTLLARELADHMRERFKATKI